MSSPYFFDNVPLQRDASPTTPIDTKRMQVLTACFVGRWLLSSDTLNAKTEAEFLNAVDEMHGYWANAQKNLEKQR